MNDKILNSGKISMGWDIEKRIMVYIFINIVENVIFLSLKYDINIF